MRFRVEIAQGQAGELGDPHPGGVEELEDRPVPHHLSSGAAWRGEEPLDLWLAERLRHPCRGPRRLDLLGRIRGRPTFVREEAVEPADSHRRTLAGRGAEPGAFEELQVVDDDRLGHLTEREMPGREELLVAAKIPAVRGDRVRGAALLHRQEREELLGVDAESGTVSPNRVTSFGVSRPKRARRGAAR